MCKKGQRSRMFVIMQIIQGEGNEEKKQVRKLFMGLAEKFSTLAEQP